MTKIQNYTQAYYTHVYNLYFFKLIRPKVERRSKPRLRFVGHCPFRRLKAFSRFVASAFRSSKASIEFRQRGKSAAALYTGIITETLIIPSIIF